MALSIQQSSAMAEKRVTPERWAFARSLWEAEPLKSFADIGASLGVSKQAVAKKAKVEGWQKRISIAQVTDRAYSEADRNQSAGGVDKPALSSGSDGEVVAPGIPANQPGRTEPLSQAEMAALAETDAVAARAEVLRRHRQEINGPRKLIYEALRSNDEPKAKLAKIAAETLKITQEAERKSWGFDRDEKVAPTIVIERGGRRD